MIQQNLQEIRDELRFAKMRYEFELSESPEGKLVVSRCGGTMRYYLSTTDADGKRSRKGIGKKPDVVKALARKEYLKKALPAIEKNLAAVEAALTKYKPFRPEEIAGELSAGFNSLPVEYFCNPLSDVVALDLDASSAERIASHYAWGNEPYETDNYMPEGRSIVTSHGERMRSKAEVLIAEKLYEYLIPFRYEQPLYLEGGMVVHPDFTFEGADGTEFYLEYCGMMDNADYVASHKRKVALYEAAGIVPWKNIVYLYGSGNEMNMQRVEAMIKTQIIPWL